MRTNMLTGAKKGIIESQNESLESGARLTGRKK